MKDKDLARLFENAFPNTLDTTVRWHVDGHQKRSKSKTSVTYPDGAWEGPQSFIVTGDINAEWLRDSTNQLAQYQALAPKDDKIKMLILGAINTQAEYVIASPYCNAFQPPPPSKLRATMNGQDDIVHPAYEPSFVFECKYELDSLAHFLALGNRFHEKTKLTAFVNDRWLLALKTLMIIMEEQSKPSFNTTTGSFEQNEYRFSRKTTAGTETLNLGGIGNPLNSGTGLVRSAFRPSDDATTFGFLVPANAMMSVELKKTAAILKLVGRNELAKDSLARAQSIDKGIMEYGVVTHKKYGEVFAFEVDGYGSQIMMDDANLPSLLALPLLGYVEASDDIYQNTRRMILEQAGNPYFLSGKAFPGIGGPHIGLQFAWPMSRLVQAMTSEDDDEIKSSLLDVLKSSKLGLVHESINVDMASQYTRKLTTQLPFRRTKYPRHLVRMGKFGLCPNNPRSSRQKASNYFWRRCSGLQPGQHRTIKGEHVLFIKDYSFSGCAPVCRYLTTPVLSAGTLFCLVGLHSNPTKQKRFRSGKIQG